MNATLLGHDTPPQDRISLFHKVMYGVGAFVNNLLAAAIGGMVIILNLGLGMNPALVGTLAAIPRLTDALTDPIMGYVSDNTKSRWGRRRPFIFAGAILAGLIFFLLWQMPEGRTESFYFWFFLTGSVFFYMAYTMFATPWVALGYELTPDYHERTRLMGVQNFTGQLAYVISPWFLWTMSNPNWFGTQLEGARGLAGAIAAVVIGFGILPAIFLRERFQQAAGDSDGSGYTWASAFGLRLRQSTRSFLQGMKLTIQSAPFVKLCIATFLVFNGFILISAFSVYVIIYHVFGGDQVLGAEYAGYAGTVGAVSTFIVIILATWLGTRFGKRTAFFITTGISVLGYLLKWFCYNPDYPWLVVVPAPLMAFGLGGLFTLVPAMMADVVDQDELQSHARREGMFGSIFWWVVKLGMAAALMGGGFLLNATGFDVALGGGQSEGTILALRLLDALVPATASIIAIWIVARYPITEAFAGEVRAQLEARRGAPAGA